MEKDGPLGGRSFLCPPFSFLNIDFFRYACVMPLVCAIIKGMKIDGVKGVNIR